MKAFEAALLCCVTAAGCGPSKHGDKPEETSRGPRRITAAAAPEPEQTAQQPTRSVFDDDSTQAEPADEPEEPEQKAEEEKRDLGAELQTALGSPVGCLEPRPADQAPERIVISVNAQVMGSGRVSRANVASSALRPGELECIRKHAESTRLSGPIDGAPLGVATSIELNQQKPAPP